MITHCCEKLNVTISDKWGGKQAIGNGASTGIHYVELSICQLQLSLIFSQLLCLCYLLYFSPPSATLHFFIIITFLENKMSKSWLQFPAGKNVIGCILALQSCHQGVGLMSHCIGMVMWHLPIQSNRHQRKQRHKNVVSNTHIHTHKQTRMNTAKNLSCCCQNSKTLYTPFLTCYPPIRRNKGTQTLTHYYLQDKITGLPLRERWCNKNIRKQKRN